MFRLTVAYILHWGREKEGVLMVLEFTETPPSAHSCPTHARGCHEGLRRCCGRLRSTNAWAFVSSMKTVAFGSTQQSCESHHGIRAD